jgi:hypothetical protein
MVAAGIENDNLHPSRAIDRPLDAVNADGLEFEVGNVLNLNVDGQKEVLAVMLETVTGVVKERGICIPCFSREFDKRLAELAFSWGSSQLWRSASKNYSV